MKKLSIAFLLSSILLVGCQSKTNINWTPLTEQTANDVFIYIDLDSLSTDSKNPDLRSANLLYNITGSIASALPYQSSIMQLTINCVEKTFLNQQNNYELLNAQGELVGVMNRADFAELAFPQDMGVYNAICK